MKALLIIVTFIGLSAVIAAVFVGMESFEGIVVEKPYETGLAWDSVEKERAALGWKVDLRTERFRAGRNTVLLALSDREGKPLPEAEVSITVSRPSTKAHDRTYRTVSRSGGLYETAVALPLFGYWDIKIVVADKGKKVVFHEKIFAEKE